MKKLFALILSTIIISTPAMGNEFACKKVFQMDNAYLMPTVLNGSFFEKTFLELPKNCVSPKAWTTNSVGVQGNILRDGLMGCLFGAIVYGLFHFIGYQVLEFL